jgi:hypothetical protein
MERNGFGNGKSRQWKERRAMDWKGMEWNTLEWKGMDTCGEAVLFGHALVRCVVCNGRQVDAKCELKEK